jgi:hypothetical protein
MIDNQNRPSRRQVEMKQERLVINVVFAEQTAVTQMQ